MERCLLDLVEPYTARLIDTDISEGTTSQLLS